MKIAMIGSGAAGSVFAAYLNQGGAEVTLVDRYKAHMDKIASDGLLFRTTSSEKLLRGFHTAASAENIGIMDMVILMVKATQTESILSSLQNCIGPETVVVSLQNGLGNEEKLEKLVPPDRILYGFGTIGTELPEPGVCVSKPEAGVIMHFGPVQAGGKAEKAGHELEACFIRGGCETRMEADIRPWIWKKAIANSGYNTVSALLRLQVGFTLGCNDGVELVKTVWEEGCAVAEAVIGTDLRPALQEELPRLQAGFATYYPSMAQDMVLHQRRTEVELLNGAIVSYGRRAGIPTPVNEALTHLVKAIESNYENQYSAV